MNSYFQGVWRMDWGLGNPNKTAALIALLMIAVWVLAYFRRWGFWAALGLFTAFGVCLIHTFSRGGLIAAFAGEAVLLWWLPRPWPIKSILAVAIAFWVIVTASIYLQAYSRYDQGMVQVDPSITNRLAIWKTVPQMMSDAPWGWGIGKSGQAYMQWYQPIDRGEQYRTLVSSHLTWLVELGWPFRFLYVLGWMLALVVCWPDKRSLQNGIPLGIWLTFLVGAFFSSVAELWLLWILPVLALAFSIWKKGKARNWPSPGVFAGIGAAALLIVVGLPEAGIKALGPNIAGSPTHVVIGMGEPTVWVLVTPTVFGNNYGKTLRTATEKIPTTGVVIDALALPSLKQKIFVTGGHPDPGTIECLKKALDGATKVILLNPSFYPEELNLNPAKTEVMFGEFSQSPSIEAWTDFLGRQPVRLQGVGDFIPEWPELIAAQRP
jgi:hypothetical protein